MKFLHQVKRDLNLGIVKRWYVYIYVIFVAVITCLAINSGIKSGAEIGIFYDRISIYDLIAEMFNGHRTYEFSLTNSFMVPVLWLSVQLGVHYLIAYYAEGDLKRNGLQVVSHSGSRASWWISKCVWCCLFVIIYYVVMAAALFITMSLLGVDISLSLSLDYQIASKGAELYYLTKKEILFVVVLVPILSTLGLCLIQMLLSLVFNPVVGFAMISVVYIGSTYYTSVFMPGNYSMLLRSSYAVEGGVSPFSGLFVGLSLIIIAIIYGTYYLNHKDLL